MKPGAVSAFDEIEQFAGQQSEKAENEVGQAAQIRAELPALDANQQSSAAHCIPIEERRDRTYHNRSDLCGAQVRSAAKPVQPVFQDLENCRHEQCQENGGEPLGLGVAKALHDRAIEACGENAKDGLGEQCGDCRLPTPMDGGDQEDWTAQHQT